jgi:hypothetical protein
MKNRTKKILIFGATILAVGGGLILSFRNGRDSIIDELYDIVQDQGDVSFMFNNKKNNSKFRMDCSLED